MVIVSELRFWCPARGRRFLPFVHSYPNKKDTAGIYDRPSHYYSMNFNGKRARGYRPKERRRVAVKKTRTRASETPRNPQFQPVRRSEISSFRRQFLGRRLNSAASWEWRRFCPLLLAAVNRCSLDSSREAASVNRITRTRWESWLNVAQPFFADLSTLTFVASWRSFESLQGGLWNIFETLAFVQSIENFPDYRRSLRPSERSSLVQSDSNYILTKCPCPPVLFVNAAAVSSSRRQNETTARNYDSS